MNQLIILTAIGPKDRPGIIAALTSAVLEAGGNLDDATMTRLHGAFATMIAARVAEPELAKLQERLRALGESHGLHITMERLPEESVEAHRKDGAPDHIITVYGADHPGIVHHVASLLEQHGVNITDLETRLVAEEGEPIYVMMVETSGGDWDQLPHALSELGRSLKVDVSYSAMNEETL